MLINPKEGKDRCTEPRHPVRHHPACGNSTDANTHLNREALREIVRAFANPKVGCVAGEKRIAVQDKANAASGGEGLYWKYESASSAGLRLYSCRRAAGELFAIRRELYEEMPADTLLDDFILSLRIVMRGYTIAYCADAYAVENGSADMHERKTQSAIAAGGLQSVWRLRTRAQPVALRCVLFSIYPTALLTMVAYACFVVPAVPPQYNSYFTDKLPLLYAVIWLLANIVLLHGKLGDIILSAKHIKNQKKYSLFLIISFHEHQCCPWLQLPAQTAGTDRRRMGKTRRA